MFSYRLFLSVFVAVHWRVFTFFLNGNKIQYFSWDSPEVTQIKRLTSVLQSVSVYTFQYDVCLFHNRSLIRSSSLVLHTGSLVFHDLLILVFMALQGPPRLKSLKFKKKSFLSKLKWNCGLFGGDSCLLELLTIGKGLYLSSLPLCCSMKWHDIY